MVNIEAINDSRIEVKNLKLKPWVPAAAIVSMISFITLGFIGLYVITPHYPYNKPVDFNLGLPLIALSLFFLIIFGAILIIDSAREEKLNKLRHDAVTGLRTLEKNFATMFEAAPDGTNNYVLNLAYKLLSKWVKLDCPDRENRHLKNEILALRVGLALILLHYPKAYGIGNHGLPMGSFDFDNVRQQTGPYVLTWQLNTNGIISLTLTQLSHGGHVPKELTIN